MENNFLGRLVCPVCHAPLIFDQQEKELICRFDRLAFPIKDGIPIMLEHEARELNADEDIKS